MTGKVYWTEARVKEMRAYANQGMTASEAAAKFNKTTMAVQWQAHRFNIRFKHGRNIGWKDEHDNVVRAMVAQGHGWKHIGLVLNKSKGAVAGYARRNGIDFIGKANIAKPPPKHAKPPPKHAKPIEIKPNPPELRKCLACGTMFPSSWIGNRRCKPCKNSVVYLNSGSAMI